MDDFYENSLADLLKNKGTFIRKTREFFHRRGFTRITNFLSYQSSRLRRISKLF